MPEDNCRIAWCEGKTHTLGVRSTVSRSSSEPLYGGEAHTNGGSKAVGPHDDTAHGGHAAKSYMWNTITGSRRQDGGLENPQSIGDFLWNCLRV